MTVVAKSWRTGRYRDKLGVITRLSANPRPAADGLFGITLDGLRCDALPLEFDLAWWMARFREQWPRQSRLRPLRWADH